MLEPETELHGLLYVSEVDQALLPSIRKVLDDILQVAVPENRSNGITGALIEANGCFMQVLEGSKTHVTRTYDRIASDRRHKHLKLLGAKSIGARVFGHWNMCARSLGGEDEAIHDVLDARGDVDLKSIEAAPALRLLKAVWQVKDSRVSYIA